MWHNYKKQNPTSELTKSLTRGCGFHKLQTSLRKCHHYPLCMILKGRHTGDSGTCGDTDMDKMASVRKSRDFQLLKCTVLITPEIGVLPIKSLLRLEGTIPKAGGNRIILSLYG